MATNYFGTFEDLTERALKDGRMTTLFDGFISFHANNIYSVQIYKKGEFKLMGIRRHDQKTNVPWKDKQLLKDTFFGEEESAIEVFPKKSKLVDSANMYWLFTGESINSLTNMATIQGNLYDKKD